MTISDFINFETFRLHNPDLSDLNERQIKTHYEMFGFKEGRIMHKLALRENLVFH